VTCPRKFRAGPSHRIRQRLREGLGILFFRCCNPTTQQVSNVTATCQLAFGPGSPTFLGSWTPSRRSLANLAEGARTLKLVMQHRESVTQPITHELVKLQSGELNKLTTRP
jgi:hypothetical protein